jgi:hypothetical protein
MEEVSAALPLLGSAGAKILKLEEVIGGQLEAEGHTLAKAVAEYVLTCFRTGTLRSPLSWWCKGPSRRQRWLPGPALKTPQGL